MHPIYYVILGLVLLLLVFVIGTFNRLKSLSLGVKEAFSTMDIYLKKRYDLIPNLVETVKRYAAHEKDTLESTAKARARAMTANTVEEKVAANNQLNEKLLYLNAVVENYPELKADVGFVKLQNQLEEIEDDIADSRLFFNGNVKIYNTTKQTFPNNLIAGMFGFKDELFFEMDSTERDTTVSVGDHL